jgi:histidyl-tRNA synthetase
MANNPDTLQNLKGFRDFLGKDARTRNWLAQVFRNVFELYGFEPLETPALEYESLLLGKYGEEANKLIYSFTDRGERKIALRYDQTVPTARVVAQHKEVIALPYMRYQIQPVWRAEKPQKGRYREFNQCDIDIIGTDSSLADALILATTSAVFEKLDLDIKIKINHRKNLTEIIRDAGIPEDKITSVIQTLDKLDKKTSTDVLQELREKEIDSIICQSLLTSLDEATLPDELKKIIDLAVSLGAKKDVFEYSSQLARGLDYYTGMIFEISISGYKAGSVGGGGRYDKLIDELVGQDLPAVGMAFGFDRLIDAMIELKKIPTTFATFPKVLVSVFGDDTSAFSASIMRLLVKNNIHAMIYPHCNKKLEAQIKYAVAKGIAYIVIAGPQEEQNKMVKLKNLLTGNQEDITIPELLERFTTKIAKK